MLGVPEDMLETCGAVSVPVAKAMAQGAATRMGTDLALSATGLAGPDGDGSGTPVGTVYLGLYARDEVRCEHHVFPGDRVSVQQQAAERGAGDGTGMVGKHRRVGHMAKVWQCVPFLW